MPKQASEQERFQEAAESAVYLVEGWENLGEIEGKLTYRGKVGPWVIMIRVDGECHSESSRVNATALCSPTEMNPEPMNIKFGPSFSREAFRRARFDGSRRILLSKKIKKTKANGAARR